MDYLDPVKSVYAVPYRTAKRFSLALLGMCSAYTFGAGPPVRVDDFAALPANAVACLWASPISGLTIPFTFVAFFYVVFTERPLLPVVVASMLLVYCHCAKPDWWMLQFWIVVGMLSGTFLLYRWLRRMYGH